jgi:drug/metabolite transporter (DMT)-like permease
MVPRTDPTTTQVFAPWLVWTILALLSWGLWAVVAKLIGGALSAEQSQALSTLGFIPVLVPLAIAAGRRLRGASRKGLLLALAGGAVSCLGNIPYYAAVARGEKFATLVSLAAMAPLVTVLLAVVLLGERLNPVQLAGLALAAVAIWIFNVPGERGGQGLLSPAVVVALLPIALWGLSGFLQKVATNHVASDAASLVYLAAFVPMGGYYALGQPWPAALGADVWALVIALGFLLAFGNFAVITAFARGGKAAVVSPLVNLFPLVSIGAALLLGESVGRRELAGIACALASVAALSRE